ncbi:hypothetical protein H9P43_001498 [Blastocladiella emersonii ATCC 22665]|nr:hypothetical protein H9P43_001498 [Blastocladiella emersonii ATCC 22665]
MPVVITAEGQVTGVPAMTYMQVHQYITLPILATLAVVARPFLHRMDLIKLAFLATVAFAYTTPWDNWIIAQGAWGYCPTCVVATVGYVPVEEYMFFVIQAVSAGILATLVFLSGPSPLHVLARVTFAARGRVLPEPSGRGCEHASLLAHVASDRPILSSKGQIAAPATSDNVAARSWTRILGVAFLSMVLAVAATQWLAIGARTFYLGAILVWAVPVLIMLWWIAGPFIWAQRRRAAVAIAIPTLYLCAVDWYALGAGAWSIMPATTVGIHFFGHLPLEEALFFFVTNVLLVFGLLTCDRTFAIMKLQGTLAASKSWPWSAQLREWVRCTLLADYAACPTQDPAWLGDLLVATELIRNGSRSFHLASKLYPWDLRTDVHAIYAFCRVTDDIADAETMSRESRRRKLDVIEKLLRASFEEDPKVFGAADSDVAKPATRSEPIHVDWSTVPDLTALQQSACRSLVRVHRQTGLPLAPVLDLLRGYRWDLDQRPVTSVDDVIEYSRYVAGTVGEMSTHLMMAAATGSRTWPNVLAQATSRAPASVAKDVLGPAIEMGVGLQLLNIARDMVTDARLGRVYVPPDFFPKRNSFSRAALVDRMAQNDLTPVDHAVLHAAAMDLVSLANSYLTRAENAGVNRLPRAFRGPVRVASAVYAQIGDALRAAAASGAPYPERVVVSSAAKLWAVVKIMYLSPTVA